jgi:hypothetical protein
MAPWRAASPVSWGVCITAVLVRVLDDCTVWLCSVRGLPHLHRRRLRADVRPGMVAFTFIARCARVLVGNVFNTSAPLLWLCRSSAATRSRSSAGA